MLNIYGSEIDKMETIHQLKSDFGYKKQMLQKYFKTDGLSGKGFESILEIDFGIEVEKCILMSEFYF